MSDTDPPGQRRLFQVSNHHSANCGTPPHIDGDTPGRRFSYFQNEYGEQAIFEFDLATRAGRIWMGDANWEEGHTVVKGIIRDLVLSPSEALWVSACWYAATGELPEPPED